jgi:TonB family protein
VTRLRLTIVAPPIAWRSARSRYVTGSLVAHLAFTVAVVWVPMLWRGPTVLPDTLAVELVGAVPESAPAEAPRPASPPETDSEPEPPVDRSALVTPPPEPTAAPKATPRPTPRPTARPAPPEPTPAASEPSAPAPDATAGASTAGSAAAGGSVSALEGLDAAFAWYRVAVTQALYSRWQRPIVDGLAEPIDVRVAFVIAREGHVGDLRIEVPSGVPVLDRSALRAVGDASPLPPLPAGLGAPLPASFVFRLYPEGG